ncbi:MAG: hypothetical protein V7605_2827, partial [Acidimicrobiaceae bacterium]
DLGQLTGQVMGHIRRQARVGQQVHRDGTTRRVAGCLYNHAKRVRAPFLATLRRDVDWGGNRLTVCSPVLGTRSSREMAKVVRGSWCWPVSPGVPIREAPLWIPTIPDSCGWATFLRLHDEVGGGLGRV